MIPRECKRLAEVDFPIAVVSRHAAREKSIRHGHPSTLHLWWARRPLAACRSVLLALLLPDPADPACPPEFKTSARRLLPRVTGDPGRTDEDLRATLLKFIGDFANWDLSSDPTFLEVSRGLVRAAHGEEPPLVVDPFAGGGSIPLEALRLGCDAFASDLNPVACLILKVMLEDIPRYGPGLAEELGRVGAQIKGEAPKELNPFYPSDPDGVRPIAYLWARTVVCESPNCGAEIPLVRSFRLGKKSKRRQALRWSVTREPTEPPRVVFEVFEPRSESEVPKGTVTRAKASCLACNTVLAPGRVHAQLAAQRGGADVVFDANGRRIGGARLLGVVTLKSGETGRSYRLPTQQDYQAVWLAVRQLHEVSGRPFEGGLRAIPDEPTPAGGGSGAGRAFSVQTYGMVTFGDLFTARQKLALLTVSSLVRRGQNSPAGELLLMMQSRLANGSSSLCRWNPNPSGFAEKIEATFSRQALPITWDFAETSPVAGTSGDIEGAVSWLMKAVSSIRDGVSRAGQVNIADAGQSPLPDEGVSVWFTDPPYYDAIPYAELSDFFLVWLKRAAPGHPLLHDPFDPTNPLTPKTRETVQDETKKCDGKPKDRVFFEAAMAGAFAEGRRVLKADGVGAVVFAHKSTEGWEALLSGMIRGGWTITASWPITTERGVRLRARDSAALATSIHLVCRPRGEDAAVGDWGAVLRELPRRVADWMERLQSEGVRGADLVFACIGPALEVFSRYQKVLDSEDREVPLGGNPEARLPHERGYLAYVWETVGRAALAQVLGTAEATARNGATAALEEDARLTALFLWTLQATNGGGGEKETDRQEAAEIEEPDEDEEAPRKQAKGLRLIYDVVRRFAQPLGIHLEEWEGRIIDTEKGVVRLLPVSERARQLFGEEGAEVAADALERGPASPQLLLFPETERTVQVRGRPRGRRTQINVPDEAFQSRREATTLDRVHAAMLLQASGRSNALRALLEAEHERGREFFRLANALAALYPEGSEERRLVQAMLLAAPR